jgi:hypothetical protein
VARDTLLQTASARTHSSSAAASTQVVQNMALTVMRMYAVLQVCVPKNTMLVVTREKGGFLSVLQSSLSTGAEPDPRLAEVRRHA